MRRVVGVLPISAIVAVLSCDYVEAQPASLGADGDLGISLERQLQLQRDDILTPLPSDPQGQREWLDDLRRKQDQLGQPDIPPPNENALPINPESPIEAVEQVLQDEDTVGVVVTEQEIQLFEDLKGELAKQNALDISPEQVNGLFSRQNDEELFGSALKSWSAQDILTDHRVLEWLRENEYKVELGQDGLQLPPYVLSPHQVRPGEEIDDPSMSNTYCSDKYCGIVAYPTLDTRITYGKDAHNEVGLMAYKTPDMITPENHCSSFAISKRFGLTALHCFGFSSDALQRLFSFSKGPVDGWSVGNRKGELDFFIAFRGQQNLRKVTKVHIPYAINELPDYASRTAPRIDLALFEFDAPLDRNPDVFQLGSKDVQPGQNVTFSGHGLTTESSITGWRRYAAFNVVASLRSDTLNDYLVWKSGEQTWSGGPCSGDSGGPVYRGYERGHLDDNDVIVALVSRFDGGGSKISTPYDCLEREGLAIRLDRHVDAVCTISDSEPAFCKQ